MRSSFSPLVAVLIVVGTLSVSCGALTADSINARLPEIQLPRGFKIELYQDGIRNARSMVLGDQGTLFVGTRTDGGVYAIVDKNKDGKGDGVVPIFKSKTLPDGKETVMPNGVAFKDGALYVATVSHILRFDDIESHLNAPPNPVIIASDYPTERHHGWKFIGFGPDGKLYVPVGAPCNICEPDAPFASMTRMNADGSGREVIARGIRQSVGFDWHPVTGELWFTDNGRDGLGDDLPSDELNHITEAGQHFGYPYVHQGDTLDPQFGAGHNPSEFTPPAMRLGPHVAAIGMRFYTGDMFPAEYKNQILIAEHGSWDRSKKIGYRITIVRLDGKKAVSYEDFATGWLSKSGYNAWGRPADVLVLPDGSLLVSDDTANAIYRITYAAQ